MRPYIDSFPSAKPLAAAAPLAFFIAACGAEGASSANEGAEVSESSPPLPEVPDELENETMYQFFYWDAYPELWGELSTPASPLHDKAQGLAEAGITATWLPPAAKGMGGGLSVGYDVYDIWDLGEFDQKGTVPTRYGTRDELEAALAELDELGLDAYYDVVFNHRMGADAEEDIPEFGTAWSSFDLVGREAHYTDDRWGYLHHDFAWNWEAFNGIDGRLFPGKSWGYTFSEAYLMGNDVDYSRQDIRHEMKAWGEWIINDIGFDGFRMDAIAHVDRDFTRQWVEHVQWATDQDVTFIAEAWVSDVGGYIDHVGTPHLDAFDFELRDEFVELSSGHKDMRWWGGLANTIAARRGVTFVDNHDTSREGNPYGTPQVDRFKNQAYAYILMRKHGVPTVYARDYDELGMAPTLDRLIEARRYFAYGPEHEQSANTEEVYAYVREGLSEVPGTGLVMLLSGRDHGGQESLWINAHQPNTTYYDYTGHIEDTVETDEHGYGSFPVHLTEATGWSVWVPKVEG